jgi:hypothetical protein
VPICVVQNTQMGWYDAKGSRRSLAAAQVRLASSSADTPGRSVWLARSLTAAAENPIVGASMEKDIPFGP